MADYLTGADIEPLIQLSCRIAKNDGHQQFSALVAALVFLAQEQKIPLKILHRALDAAWNYDGSKPSGPINLFDQA